jgi:CBS domain-containing protein
MFYLSERLGSEVLDVDGQPAGKLTDLVVPPDSDAVSAAVLNVPGRGEALAPFAELSTGPDVPLQFRRDRWTEHQAVEGEIRLARDVLDHKVVDASRARLVRVNAILVEETAEGWRVSGVEVGNRGLLHRLGADGVADALHLAPSLVPWADVGLAQGRTDRLEQMRPAEIAAIIHNLPPAQGSDLVEALNDEVAADTLEEVHPDRQAGLLEDMPPERAADILEEMAPDEAADVLQDMSTAKAQELLGLMEREEAAEASELLAHDEDSAGGLMTTEYAALPPDLTAGAALAELRRRYSGEIDDLHYVYVIDEQERLLGVTSLWDLVMANPDAALNDFMEKRPVFVTPDQKAEEAARLISRFNILAIPVVGEDQRLLGVVTVDDAMDLLLPENWRGRLPHMY